MSRGIAGLLQRASARHVVWNLLGFVVPAGVALLVVPSLARRLDPDRFALLALLWSVISFYAMLDLGVGRALALRVTASLATGRDDSVGPLIWNAGWLAWFGGAPLALLGVLSAPWLTDRLDLASPGAARDATVVIRWLAIALPFVVHGVLLRAAFEGARRYELVNLLRAPMMLATYLAPLGVVTLGGGVVAMAQVIVGTRLIYLLGQLLLLDRLAPHTRRPRRFEPIMVRDLVGSGAWIMASALVSPLLLQGDRLLLPLVVPLSDFGWYATVAEGAMRLWMLTGALQPVLFTRLVTAAAEEGPPPTEAVRWSIHATVGLLVPPSVALLLAADPLLRWWLGPVFNPQAVWVIGLVLVGVVAGGFSQVAYAVLQSHHQARAVALLHLLQLPFLGVMLVGGSVWWGVLGAAAAWSARLIVDAVLMWRLVFRRVPTLRAMSGQAVRWGLVSLALLIAAVWIGGPVTG